MKLTSKRIFYSVILSFGFLMIACSPPKNVKEGRESEIEELESQPSKENKVVEPTDNDWIKSDSGIVNFENLIKNRKKVYLSDLAKSIEYIPLETTPEFMVDGKNVHIKPCGEYLFVSQHGKPLGAFDREGKFIRTIGKIGRGPEEYNFDFSFWPEGESERVYFWNANGGTIMAYSFEGEYIQDIKPEKKFGSFVPIGDGKFLCWNFRQSEIDGKYFRLFFIDESGKTLQRVFEPEREFSIAGGIMSPLFTPTNDGFLYNSWEEEVIYRVNCKASFTPALRWELDKFKMPFDLRENYERWKRERSNYVGDVNACESPGKWYFKYYYKNLLEMAVYDKRTGVSMVVSNPDRDKPGVINDIDGGPSFWPFWDTENGRKFISFIDAFELIENSNQANGKVVEFKDSLAANNFQQMISGLKENSNPVVMMVELK